jgi:hypothetical protein
MRRVLSYELEIMFSEEKMKEMEVTPSECAKRERPSERKMGPSVEPLATRSEESHAEERIGEENGKWKMRNF